MSRESRIARAKAKRRRKQRPWIVAAATLVAVVVAGFAYLLTRDDGSVTTAGPCVTRTGELPDGAPEVPVRVGPAPTELVTEDLVVGDGAPVGPGDTVTVHYVGVACSTGAVFDSSYTAGEPISLSLDQVIRGWQEGIPGMNVGGRRLLGIPAADAYGAPGRPPSIGPNEALWFVVDVVELGGG